MLFLLPEMLCVYKIRYLHCYYYHLVNTFADVLLVLQGIIHPVFSALSLAWFIRDICV
jgi:hypothetical protein